MGCIPTSCQLVYSCHFVGRFWGNCRLLTIPIKVDNIITAYHPKKYSHHSLELPADQELAPLFIPTYSLSIPTTTVASTRCPPGPIRTEEGYIEQPKVTTPATRLVPAQRVQVNLHNESPTKASLDPNHAKKEQA